MNIKNFTILIVGVILVFIAMYLFTRPAIFDIWDFSETGPVGDTIGGISAPVINLFGAFLVYISFKEQIKANDNQSIALADEKRENNKSNQYNRHLSLLDEVKNRLHDLQFVVVIPIETSIKESNIQPLVVTYNGIDALNEAINRQYSKNGKNSKSYLKYKNERFNTYGIFLNFQFVLTTVYDLIERIETNIDDKQDQTFLISNLDLFYKIYLLSFANRIISAFDFGQEEIKELIKVKSKIDKKLNIQQTK
ncbi:hypothetical protein GCQ56_19040 [Marinifilum sp. N1E240]|uniref:hypothetical protein n=1 Tax=Marinifilum sp. N1E240 TaxID=2608082 RepID=UPI00128CB451|nr:hypothetical protein [Marinifilum sp. N1E240]MPQ49100.1 hypothetical protein [Marinifilum sp. N1E240]